MGAGTSVAGQVYAVGKDGKAGKVCLPGDGQRVDCKKELRYIIMHLEVGLIFFEIDLFLFVNYMYWFNLEQVIAQLMWCSINTPIKVIQQLGREGLSVIPNVQVTINDLDIFWRALREVNFF